MITKAIEKAFGFAKAKGWEKTYWAIDVHDTIIVPNYSLSEIPKEFYPKAKEIMHLISQRSDIVLILYTCSHPNEIEKYLEYFKEFDIHFDYVNENPEVENMGYGFYDRKFYFNVLFEDKAGFDPYTDWELVEQLLAKHPELNS
jgi:hypothetical protein